MDAVDSFRIATTLHRKTLFGIPISTPRLDIQLVINGLSLPVKASSSVVSIRSLLASMNSEGEFYIFNCSCGAPGCVGINNGIEVVHFDQKTLWNDCGVFHCFSSQQYRAEINSLRQSIQALHNQHPSLSLPCQTDNESWGWLSINEMECPTKMG